jgi:hypothetical protein
MDDALLRAECARCAALCCVTLAFDASDLFAFDKAAGEPCPHFDGQRSLRHSRRAREPRLRRLRRVRLPRRGTASHARDLRRPILAGASSARRVDVRCVSCHAPRARALVDVAHSGALAARWRTSRAAAGAREPTEPAVGLDARDAGGVRARPRPVADRVVSAELASGPAPEPTARAPLAQPSC